MSVSLIRRGRCNNKLTGNTVRMVLSWLMPYFASARRPDRERTTKRHCAHTTWMWHPRHRDLKGLRAARPRVYTRLRILENESSETETRERGDAGWPSG